MNKKSSTSSKSMLLPNPYVIPLPLGDPGHANPVKISNLRIRNRIIEIQRLLQILRESSFEKRGGIGHALDGSVDCVKELERIYQYASALLLCNEIPRLTSTRRYPDNVNIEPRLNQDHKMIGYAWNSWWQLIMNERKSTALWGLNFQDHSHPIAHIIDDGNFVVGNGGKMTARPYLFRPLYSDKQYAIKAANFMRTSMQEKKYILKFFQDIGKIKKKIMICRFNIFMNRFNLASADNKSWEQRLREKIRQLAERTKYEYKSLAGYLHFIPSSNFMAPFESPSFSHLIMIFDLAKSDHHMLSKIIASSRTIQGEDNYIECRPTCAEQESYKAIGCGVLDLSRVFSLPIIHEIADYMTVERRILRPLVPRRDAPGRQVIKGLQLHSFL